MSDSGSLQQPGTHVVLLPSAGMGHLTPFLRLAAMLVQNQCRVTLITIHPTVSLAETSLLSRFLKAFSQVHHTEFHLLPIDPATANTNDPFVLRFESTRRSAHLLAPLLSSVSPPPSALVHDHTLITPVLPVIECLDFRLPAYILWASSARMLAFLAHHNTGIPLASDVLEIPGVVPPIASSSMPPFLQIPNGAFANMFLTDARNVTKLSGVLINSFEDGLEAEAMLALNGGKVVQGFPPVVPVGPLVQYEFEKGEEDQSGNAELKKWLDDQDEGSVVYVSFGSRTALSRDQLMELSDGLVKSGFKFLWVVKEKLVDREEEDSDLEIMEKMKGKGHVVKHWVDQGDILSHKAVGGFVSHCGWNSVIEAAWHGVRILAWPIHGDQRINAELVESTGLGNWAKTWAWTGDRPTVVVKADEIADKIKELMQSEALRLQAVKIRQEAKRVSGAGGCREKNLKGLIEKWNKN